MYDLFLDIVIMSELSYIFKKVTDCDINKFVIKEI